MMECVLGNLEPNLQIQAREDDLTATSRQMGFDVHPIMQNTNDRNPHFRLTIKDEVTPNGIFTVALPDVITRNDLPDFDR